MLMRTDPFRELDRFAQQVFGGQTPGTWSRPTPMPMDAYRHGDKYVVAFDLPGVSPDAIDLDVERNVLTVKAERRPAELGEGVEMQVAERPLGVFSRQLFLGDTLDAEHIEASYESGVLTLKIPVAEQAKPRKIEITKADSGQKQIDV
ncbi:Hsp20/alpha crystallin family protein [Kribbella swartbergensis]